VANSAELSVTIGKSSRERASAGSARVGGSNVDVAAKLILVALPWVLFSINHNWPFQALGNMDPWYYLGSFILWPHTLVNYPPERLTWVLPGWALRHILPIPYSVLLLHVGFYYLTVFCIFILVRRFAGTRSALATSCLLGCYSCFLCANGWEYVDGASIGYLSLTLLLIHNSATKKYRVLWMLAAGASGAALVFTYLLWLIFLPGFLLFYLFVATAGSSGAGVLSPFRRGIIFCILCSTGFAMLTGVLQLISSMAGLRGFFFENNIETAIFIGSMAHNPWSSNNWEWVWTAGWLVFPALALAAIVGVLVRGAATGFERLPRMALGVGLLCLYALAMMIVMTVRQTHVLEFDYFADILIPFMFLFFGVFLLRVPENLHNAIFFGVLLAGMAMCSACLAVLGLADTMVSRGLWPFYVVGLVGVLVRLLWSNRTAWCICVLGLSAACFGPLPAYRRLAYVNYHFSGWDAEKRIAAAVYAIHKHLPEGAIANCWLDNNTPRPFTSEYRGIMCGLMTNNMSMWNYPKIDKRYAAGSYLVILTDGIEDFKSDNAAMTQAGMPLKWLEEKRISYDGSYFFLTITQVEATSSPSASFLGSQIPITP
jgi:hypothetical protein